MTTSYLYFSDSRIWLIVCSVNLEMSRTDSYARLSCDLVGLKKCYFQQLNRKCDKNAKTLFTTKFVFWVKFFFWGGEVNLSVSGIGSWGIIIKSKVRRPPRAWFWIASVWVWVTLSVSVVATFGSLLRTPPPKKWMYLDLVNGYLKSRTAIAPLLSLSLSHTRTHPPTHTHTHTLAQSLCRFGSWRLQPTDLVLNSETKKLVTINQGNSVECQVCVSERERERDWRRYFCAIVFLKAGLPNVTSKIVLINLAEFLLVLCGWSNFM